MQVCLRFSLISSSIRSIHGGSRATISAYSRSIQMCWKGSALESSFRFQEYRLIGHNATDVEYSASICICFVLLDSHLRIAHNANVLAR